jgi:sulfate adenylyltransferase subunit 2
MSNYRISHLKQLEAESIHIIREVAAEFQNPVMLYSTGKDSSVMLRLAEKAFYPAKIPFPFMHIDTNWKFKEMIAFREKAARNAGFELKVYMNPDGVRDGINPFDHGSEQHTRIMKTEALKKALNLYGFDAAFGGARRDEERSRAKERIFSFRDRYHQWDPKNQRPELWNLYNCRIKPGESIRVFPLSDWTELDIWHYIKIEEIPVVSLYFARERQVVEKNGRFILADDDRVRLEPGDKMVTKKVRFRTLGCYPLTEAVESDAETVEEIIRETFLATSSERQGRVIDYDGAGSMEEKKKDGYF